MRTLTITMTTDWRASLDRAGEDFIAAWQHGGYQGESLLFETPAMFFGRLSARCWEIVRALQGRGPLIVRELARSIGRDVRRVHEDVRALVELGLIEKTPDGRIECPFADIHVDMHLQQAA